MSILYSCRKIFQCITKLLLIGFLFSSFINLSIKVALANEKENIPSHSFIIGQESFETQGVLVARPNPSDVQIFNLMTANNIHSLEDYAQWLKGNIKYQSDGPQDTWATPMELLHKRSGDCEDYAFLNLAVLKILGYQPHFFALGRPGNFHAICLFKVNDDYVWFDNTELRRTKTKTIIEFAQQIVQNYDYTSLHELDPKTKKWQLIFKKS